MSQLTGGPGLVRVTVASSTRRADLVLPGSVPVAELLPELARSVGLLDAATVHDGYGLTLVDGRALSSDVGLIPQGVVDGGVLAISVGVGQPPGRIYDDAVEAMIEVVEGDLAPWLPATARRTALVMAGLLLLLGAGTLLAVREAAAPGVAAAIAVVLDAGAIVLSRIGREPLAGAAVAAIAAAYAVVAGVTARGQPLAYAGLGLLATGAVAVAGLGAGRAFAVPVVVVGSVLGACGGSRQVLGWPPAETMSVVLVGAVLGAGAVPRLSLALSSRGSLEAPLGLEHVRGTVRDAHQTMLGLSATLGALLLVGAPFAVTLGRSGTLLATATSLAVLVRTRHHRGRADVLVGLVSGIGGLTATVVAASRADPGARPILAGVLVVAGLVLLALTMVPDGVRGGRGRLVDVTETACLLALLPLLAAATGLVTRVA